jgi:exonuclease SbcD
MTRVIHTGDTHLGYQQYHSPTRREDFLAAFRQVVEDAVDDEVDAVVHAGDLFHDRRPDLPDLLGTLSVLRTLADADIPFLAIVGNHEGKRDAQWLDLFSSLGLATRLGREPVVLGNTAFYGLDFVPRSQRDALEYDFEPHDAEFATLVAHGLFEPFDLGEWDAAEIIEESNVAFDALLFGDNHTPETKRTDDGVWLTYCGSTERASASERDDRGYNIVTFEEEVQITRRGIPTRPFAFIDIELGEEEGFERVRKRIEEYDLEGAVAILTLTGEGEEVSHARVEERLDEAGALVGRVNDRREIEAADADIEVSFADPDDAVRERIRGMGLSPAARDVDEIVRASKVTDSNVDGEVERRVRALLETEEATAFTSAPPADDDAPQPTSETAAARLAGQADGGTEETSTDASDAEAEAATNEAEADPEPVDDAETDAPADATPPDDPDPEPEAAESAAVDTPGDETAQDENAQRTGDGDDQSSLGDY